MSTRDQTGQNKNNKGGQNKNERSNPDKIKTMKEFPASKSEAIPQNDQVPSMAEENIPIRGLEVNFAGIHVAKNIIC